MTVFIEMSCRVKNSQDVAVRCQKLIISQLVAETDQDTVAGRIMIIILAVTVQVSPKEHF